METWRDVIGFEGIYQVSDCGRVRNSSGKILRLYLGRQSVDYPRIELSANGVARKYSVHRLVLEAFIGPSPTRAVGNHKNGDKRDNRLANLEYMTSSENSIHAARVLKTHKQKGSKHGLHKLVESEVLQIIARTETGEPLSTIAADFSVCLGTVSMIATGKTWRHLPRKPQEDRRKSYGREGSNWSEDYIRPFQFPKA